jgi:hypothetical protein
VDVLQHVVAKDHIEARVLERNPVVARCYLQDPAFLLQTRGMGTLLEGKVAPIGIETLGEQKLDHRSRSAPEVQHPFRWRHGVPHFGQNAYGSHRAFRELRQV